MAKILLVEDDTNLREIFEMRLQAEGYDTVTASDGEEALDVATKEKPALIIADVMMPKLSGFEMLETLRAAPNMANIKVIMMTALGQAEDRARGEKLGVVKYLVKSQVTLEDFVQAVREVMPPDAADSTDKPSEQGNKIINKQESEQSMQDDNTNQAMPPADSSASGAPPAGDGSAAPADEQMSTAQEQNVVNNQLSDYTSSEPTNPPAPTAGDTPPAPSGSDFPTSEPTPPMPADNSPMPPTDQPPSEEPKPADGPVTTPPAGM
jgi:CheY-like chemotaxis protein